MKYIHIKTLSVLLILFIGFSAFINKPTYTSKETTVYIFLSETCPICQSYTLTLKELYKKYSDKHVKFVGVFPNYYADSDEIQKFKEKYSIPFPLIIDGGAELTKRFGATITPEVFVENSDQQLLYSGRIDDSFYAIGKRRKVITATELVDALNAIVNNETIKVNKTQAVGCIISISK